MKIRVSAFAWTTELTQSHLNLLPKTSEYGLDGFEIQMFDPASLPVAELRRAFEGSGLECKVWPYFRRGGIFTNRRQKSVAHSRHALKYPANWERI